MVSNLSKHADLKGDSFKKSICGQLRCKEAFCEGSALQSGFLEVQAITLDTSGCDSVTEQIDIGTNLLYDVLELWSGSQPKPINPIPERWDALSRRIGITQVFALPALN